MLRTYSCKMLRTYSCKMLRTYSSYNVLKKKVVPNFNCIYCKGNGLSICLKCKGFGKIYEGRKEYNCNCCFFGQTICFYCNGTGVIHTTF